MEQVLWTSIAKKYAIGSEINSLEELQKKNRDFPKTQNSVKHLNQLGCQHLINKKYQQSHTTFIICTKHIINESSKPI